MLVAGGASCAETPKSAYPQASTSATVSSDEPHGVLRVRVRGVAPLRGNVIVAVYEGADRFPKSKRESYLGKAVAAGDPTLVEIEDVAAGVYACAVFHDVDGDGSLDTNFVGYPSEPFGFSNNAHVALFGPPSFQDAAFDVRGPETTIEITLQH